ncbi:MAG: cyclopropane-fatty-acyl-phospholipid synthase family protein [Vicinamibacterales bacterium]
MPAPSFSTASVRDYYDRNTPAFLRLGQGAGAIHRAVWGPGVTSRAEAFSYVDALVATEVRALFASRELHVVDLGCGVGASIASLARALPIRGTGVTLSPVQARIAAERLAAAGLADRVRCVEGDYTALPPTVADADAAYAIESFVHGPSPERFFAEAARIIRPGGVLIICDDVRRESSDPRAARVTEQFARGWHVNTLVTSGELQQLAATAGFDHDRTIDLTPYLELGRPRDRAIRLLAAVAQWLPVQPTWLAPLVGGSALQEGLQRGWLAYEFAIFRRRIDSAGP